MGFSYTIQYKSGIENLAADALSRISGTEILLMAISLINFDLQEKIQQSYEHDLNLQRIVASFQHGDHLSSFTLTVGLLRMKGKLV